MYRAEHVVPVIGIFNARKELPPQSDDQDWASGIPTLQQGGAGRRPGAEH
jgi:hypothetical protein